MKMEIKDLKENLKMVIEEKEYSIM